MTGYRRLSEPNYDKIPEVTKSEASVLRTHGLLGS
jgi:hypothetical protein